MATKRRTRLVPRGGVECYEVRTVTSINANGKLVTLTEITTPEATDFPALHEVLGTMEVAKADIVRAYDEDDEDE